MDQFSPTFQPTAVSAESTLIRSVFNWMAVGLLTTAVVSWYLLSNPEQFAALFSPGRMMFLIFAELGLVMWLSFRVMKMSPGAATAAFLGYSALNGITLAPLAFVYTGESISTAFFVSAGLFGAMALYGSTTQRDLTGMGSFMMMGLFGIIIASVVNLFMHSSGLNFAISVLGVLIFTGLTAWDVQKIRRFSSGMLEGSENAHRVAIIGALTLYLDFINLFLNILRLMGNRRD